MHGLPFVITTFLLVIPALSEKFSGKPPSKNAILLSNVNTLTLRANSMTTSRRVSPIPQLSCVGPSKKICDLYQPDTMRCTNEGFGYDEEDVQWTCEAALPSEFKLGATDVVCEGYRNSHDNWVLKGSCGVEYRLILTEQGERRFGKIDKAQDRNEISHLSTVTEAIANILFFIFVFGILGVILFVACCSSSTNRRPREQRRGRGGHGGDGPGGGGGGGGYGPYPGPPPPYGSWDKPSYPGTSSQQGWTPGFWTGALGGGAAGYGLGRRAGRGESSQRNSADQFGGYNAGEGSSHSARVQSPPRFSSTSSSTGFGSTKRR